MNYFYSWLLLGVIGMLIGGKEFNSSLDDMAMNYCKNSGHSNVIFLAKIQLRIMAILILGQISAFMKIKRIICWPVRRLIRRKRIKKLVEKIKLTGIKRTDLEIRIKASYMMQRTLNIKIIRNKKGMKSIEDGNIPVSLKKKKKT